MCCKMAEHAANQRDHDPAIRLYKEALDYTPEDHVTLLALARLYLQVFKFFMIQILVINRTSKMIRSKGYFI